MMTYHLRISRPSCQKFDTLSEEAFRVGWQGAKYGTSCMHTHKHTHMSQTHILQQGFWTEINDTHIPNTFCRGACMWLLVTNVGEDWLHSETKKVIFLHSTFKTKNFRKCLGKGNKISDVHIHKDNPTNLFHIIIFILFFI